METVLEFLALMMLTIVVFAVAIPLTLIFLVMRQVRRARRRRFGPRRGPAVTPSPRLDRRWARLRREAVVAAQRYEAAVAGVAPGPLRDSLHAARDEVAVAVAEAQRLAEHANSTERAQRQVLAALRVQQRRQQRLGDVGADVRGPLLAATQAQRDSLARLTATLQRDEQQLQMVLARLNELVAHALELCAGVPSLDAPGVTSAADHLAALRAATAELARAVHA